MELKTIIGFDNYAIDMQNLDVYNTKRKTRTPLCKHRSVYVILDKRMYSIYKIAYCVNHGIDVRKVPERYAFAMNDDKDIEVVSHSNIASKSHATRKQRYDDSLARLRKELDLIEKYVSNGSSELLGEIIKIERKVASNMIKTYSMSQERADLCAEIAGERYLADVERGHYRLGMLAIINKKALAVWREKRTAIWNTTMKEYSAN